MTEKKLSFGKSINQKYEELQNSSEKITNEIINEVSRIISNRSDAMQEFKLKPEVVGGRYELEKDIYDSLCWLSKNMKKPLVALASSYVLEGMKKDLEKRNKLLYDQVFLKNK